MKKRHTLSKSQIRELQRKADELYRRGLIKTPINVDKYFLRTKPNSIDTFNCFREIQSTFDELYRRGWIKKPINVEKSVQEHFLAS
jgi:hypothetical protein